MMAGLNEKGKEELKRIEKEITSGALNNIFRTNEYGAYKYKSQNPDTVGLRIYKDTRLDPVEKFNKFIEMLEVEPAGLPQWYKFYYRSGKGNETLIFMHEKELVSILAALAHGFTPYYWGAFGIGKTFKTNRILKKLFGRVTSIRLFKNETPEDLFGSVDALSVYTISSVLKDALLGYNINQLMIKEVVDELSKDALLLNSYLNSSNLDDSSKSMLRERFLALKIETLLGNHLSSKDILELSQELNNKLRILKLSSFNFAEIGKALEDNTALLIDEVDKVSEKDLNYISQIVQPKDRAIQIVGFGTFEFNQPTVLLGNKENIDRFIKSRVVVVQAVVPPKQLLKELLISEGIIDKNIINALLKQAPKLETGELSIRELINQGLIAQQLKKQQKVSKLPFSIDPVSAILEQ